MKYFIHLPMKMEPTVSSETSAIRTQTPGNYPKRNKLHLEHGESLKTRMISKYSVEPDRPQMIIQYGACALNAGRLRLQTHTQIILLLSLLLTSTGFIPGGSALQCNRVQYKNNTIQ